MIVDVRTGQGYQKMDNTIAVVYINRRGGTASTVLSDLARDLWLWYTERHILIQVQHLSGSMNSMAGLEFRAHPDRSDWKLAPTICIFQKIHHLLGPLSIGLFASCLSTQLPFYISWKPDHDPLAMETDAFSMDWSVSQARSLPIHLGGDRQSPGSDA